MAYYEGIIIVPPNTPEHTPAEIVVRPLQGLIKNVSVLFPAGALGLVKIRIMEDNRQFAPANSGWISDNNKEVNFQANRQMQGPPYRVVIQGYSNASDWLHTITVRMEIV
jgi:hypothetical protein